MMLNVSAKALALLLAIGATSATGSNLRQRMTLFNHGHADRDPTTVAKAKCGNLRSPASASASASVDGAEQQLQHQAQQQQQQEEPAPSLSTAKSTYSESEAITISLTVGSPHHPYYGSTDAPSLDLEYDYPKWSVGLFMRDADPQGGTLSPIVSVNLCGAIKGGCDANDSGGYGQFDGVSVTFGDAEQRYEMQGQWPLEVSEYGTGFDAYVLDGKGAGAIGPLEFYIQSDDGGDVGVNGPVVYDPTHTGHEEMVSEASVEVDNSKIASASGLEVHEPLMEEVPAATEGAFSEEVASPSEGSIQSNKEAYDEDEAVSINFALDGTMDPSKYRIGIYMRMAHPQGGALPPVVSLPLCSDGPCISNQGVAYSGAVTFSYENMGLMEPEGAMWPMDLYEYGTGYDAYILDESGAAVMGPVKFNIMMSGTG